MGNTLDVGSITLFLNGPVDQRGWLSKDDAQVLAATLEDEFRSRFAQSLVNNFFQITSVKWKQGCVLETISFGVIASLAYKGIKDYPKFREGLIALCKDIEYVLLKARDKETRHRVAIYRTDLLTKEEIEAALEYRSRYKETSEE